MEHNRTVCVCVCVCFMSRTSDVQGMTKSGTGIESHDLEETEEDTSESGCGVKGHPPDSGSEPGPSDQRTGADPHEPCPSTSESHLKESEDGVEDCVDPDPPTDPEDPEKQQLVCTEAQAGASDWEEFTPEVSAESGHVSYRFRCPRSGSFYCTQTGLVFVVDGEAGLQYRTVQWDEDLLESTGSTAAGPMLSIECPENAVRQLHFPHCETDPVQNSLCVVHVSDDGMNFIEPLKITESHVVISVSSLSLYGLLERVVRFFRSVRTQILLFLSPPNTRTQRQNLNMLLLPSNVPVESVKAKHLGDEYIKVPSKCKLIKHQRYSVVCPEACLIQPEEEEFDLDFGPNFHSMFEVRLPPNTKKVTLTIQDEENVTVWKRTPELPGSGPAQSPGKELESFRVEFINRVSDQTLSNLLDKLLEKRVITRHEMEAAQTKHGAEKARQVMDTVMKKGAQASSVLVNALCEVDPCVSRQLKLM